MSKHLLYFLVINILITLLLAWQTFGRYTDFKKHHVALATESVNSLSLEISNFIKERQRLVGLFAQEHKDLITQLTNNPDNDVLKSSVKNKLADYFPRFYTFTVTDNKGTPYLIDFDGQVGELCVKDINIFSSSGKNNPQVHPGIDAYHFDIMSSLETTSGKLIFFVSFHADILSHIIQAIETPEHHLELVLNNERLLLEVTKEGARNNTLRDDYRLSPGETARILASTPVNNTRWHAIDLYQPLLFSTYIKKRLIESSVLLLIFMLITAFFYYHIKKEELRRIIAENSKNEFLSIISHELRTPLTSIYGSISLLADKKLNISSDESKNMLDVAKRNASHLMHLINEILDFRKIESGNVEYNFQVAEINGVIQEAIEGMDEYARQYDSSVVFKKYDKSIYVLIDRLRIIQVVNNLLSNAIKYGSQNDPVIIEVAFTNNSVRVSFHDKGPGIPEEFTSKIFDKFSQANIHNKTKGSTGLGLNIARTFIEAHHGTLDFTTSTHGTTFYFELPVEEQV